jgi:hypothetical protein
MMWLCYLKENGYMHVQDQRKNVCHYVSNYWEKKTRVYYSPCLYTPLIIYLKLTSLPKDPLWKDSCVLSYFLRSKVEIPEEVEKCKISGCSDSAISYPYQIQKLF